MRIERRAEWNEETNDWLIPNIEFTGNNIKLQKAKKKEGKENGQHHFMYENILNM